MSKTTEAAMNALHGAVATVLQEQLSYKEESTMINADGEIVGTGEERFVATPATIAAAIKFLKDNDITVDITQDENLNGLKDTLAKKQKRSRMGSGSSAALSLVED